MKTIYLCEKADTVAKVYGIDCAVYTKADVLNDPESFAKTEYIFSTWGMPEFSEEDDPFGSVENCGFLSTFGLYNARKSAVARMATITKIKIPQRTRSTFFLGLFI